MDLKPLKARLSVPKYTVLQSQLKQQRACKTCGLQYGEDPSKRVKHAFSTTAASRKAQMDEGSQTKLRICMLFHLQIANVYAQHLDSFRFRLIFQNVFPNFRVNIYFSKTMRLKLYMWRCKLYYFKFSFSFDKFMYTLRACTIAYLIKR